MAFKLTKGELAERDTHVEKLRALAGRIEDEVAEANGKLGDLLQPVREAITAYNTYLTEAVSGFTSNVGNRLTEEMDEKSEKWQESEKASAVSALIQEWESVALDEIDDLDEMEIAVEIPENADALDGISLEAEAT